MLKVKVTSEFIDKFNPSSKFKVGEVVEFDDKRANNIVERNLGVFLEGTKEQENAPKSEQPIETETAIAEGVDAPQQSESEDVQAEEQVEKEETTETAKPAKRGRRPKTEE